jgi:hypothetical protein
MLSEWNVSAPQAPDGDDRIARIESGHGAADLHRASRELRGIRSFLIRGSAAYGVSAEVRGADEVWHFPVETVSSSEGGLERVPQGASVSVVRPFTLAPGESLEFDVTWRVVDVGPATFDD